MADFHPLLTFLSIKHNNLNYGLTELLTEGKTNNIFRPGQVVKAIFLPHTFFRVTELSNYEYELIKSIGTILVSWYLMRLVLSTLSILTISYYYIPAVNVVLCEWKEFQNSCLHFLKYKIKYMDFCLADQERTPSSKSVRIPVILEIHTTVNVGKIN